MPRAAAAAPAYSAPGLETAGHLSGVDPKRASSLVVLLDPWVRGCPSGLVVTRNLDRHPLLGLLGPGHMRSDPEQQPRNWSSSIPLRADRLGHHALQ